MHRPLPADTELARSITVLAHAHQDATWRRSRASNELRSLVGDYHQGFLAAFFGGSATNVATANARAVLAIAPTRAATVKLTKARLAAALRRGGRQRGVDKLAERLHRDFRLPQLRQDPMVEEAMGAPALRLLATPNTECDSVDQLGDVVSEAFTTHPDHKIITSFTGLGDVTGARLLAEIGDDRSRFAEARSVKAYAGSAPITRASGRSLSVTRRRVKNNRLAAAGFVWAFVAATHSPGASTLYYRCREHGDRHAAALRNVFNRLIGCLFHCLQTGQTYDEATAFPAASKQPIAIAA